MSRVLVKVEHPCWVILKWPETILLNSELLSMYILLAKHTYFITLEENFPKWYFTDKTSLSLRIIPILLQNYWETQIGFMQIKLFLFFILYTFFIVSVLAQLVKNPPAVQETLVRFLGQEDPLVPTPVFLGFPGGSAGKESACNAGKPGFNSWTGKTP